MTAPILRYHIGALSADVASIPRAPVTPYYLAFQPLRYLANINLAYLSMAAALPPA